MVEGHSVTEEEVYNLVEVKKRKKKRGLGLVRK